jgi:hypothetical protein
MIKNHDILLFKTFFIISVTQIIINIFSHDDLLNNFSSVFFFTLMLWIFGRSYKNGI